MPLIPDDNMQYSLDRVVDYVSPGVDPTFGEKLGSAFRIENTIGSFLAREGNLPDGYADTDYDVFSKLTEEEKLNQDFAKNAAYVDNDAELEAVRNQYKREMDDRGKLTGLDGVAAALMAGSFDLINLIPVGGVAAKAYRSGNVLKGALATGLVASGTASATEVALHQTQLTRTGDESLANVTGAMLLGGMLGAGVAKLNSIEINRISKEVEDSFNGPLVNTTTTDSVGAQAVWGDLRVKGAFVEKALKGLAPIDPLARVMTATSKAARKYGTILAENPLEIEIEAGLDDLGNKMYKTYSGRSIEQSAKTRKDMLFNQGLITHLDEFEKMKKSGGKVKHRQFNELTSREVRNPGSTGNEFARRSADNWVKKVYDPVAKDLQDLGMLGDDLDVDTAARYLNRRWNKEALAGKQGQFVDVVTKWLKAEQPDIVDPEDLAKEISLKILGTQDGVLKYDAVIREGDEISKAPTKKKGTASRRLRSTFKARSFLIPDELVEEFLENDIESLAYLYLRNTVPDAEIIRAMGSPKTPIDETLSFSNIQKEIAKDYQNMALKHTGKKAKKLKEEGEAVIKALLGMRDRIRGVYDLPDGDPTRLRRFNTAFRNLNYVRLMGGVVASSIPDIGKQVMSEGFMRAFGDGFVPMIRNIRKLKPIQSEARYYGIAADTITSGRIEALTDINSYALGNTKVERGLEYLSNNFGNIVLINQWNDLMKMTHAMTMQARVYDDLAKGKFDNRLARLGLTEEDAKGIFNLAKKHGEVLNGSRLYHPEKWEDQRLAFAWASALRKESDRVVIVPGQEKPLFMSTDMGKTILQFRSFMLASTQRTLLASAQGQEANMLGGMLTMITMGALVYAFKQWDSGREISDDPMVWVAEGIDRSGALGILMEASNTTEKLSGNRIGLRAAMGISEPASRFASRSEYESALGPTYGSALPNLIRIGQAGLDENEWKESDTSSIRRMLPYQNTTFLRRGIDAVEEKIHEATQ